MRKIVLSLVVTALMAATVQAAPSLGWWEEGHNGATHQYWDFTPGHVNPIGGGFGAVPEQIVNPVADQVMLQITAFGGPLAWDQASAIIGPEIYMDAKVYNYTTQNPTKEIWVELGFIQGAGALWGIPSIIAPGGVQYEVLQGPGPNGNADFGFVIHPNPEWEDILFVVKGAAAPAMLDYVHIDTICVPVPGAVLLGGLGVGLVGWLRRRRAL